jgi:hypothetical protein
MCGWAIDAVGRIRPFILCGMEGRIFRESTSQLREDNSQETAAVRRHATLRRALEEDAANSKQET